MKKNCNRISVQKVAAIGVLGLAYMAAYCFGNFIGKRTLSIPVKIIISGIGGTIIGITGGEIAKKLWEDDNPAETIGKLIESLREVGANNPG